MSWKASHRTASCTGSNHARSSETANSAPATDREETLVVPAIAIVIAHAVVLVAHDVAHRDLVVLLNAWQQAFVYSVIVPGPFIALLLLRRYRREGYALLLVAMLGSLLFGLYHHYVAVSPDHVDHLPAGDSQGLFRVTALLMILVESAGVVVAALGLRSTR